MATSDEENPVFVVVHCPWCDEAEGSSVTIGIDKYRWRIHKCLITRKSAYFDRALRSGGDAAAPLLLPASFPGGAAALDAVVSFCFDASVPVIRTSNVAALRCAAEFLGMAGGATSLSQRSDDFLVHVSLRSWEGAMTVLAQSATLLPLAEHVNVVHRCIEAISRNVALDDVETSSSSKLDDLSRLAPPCFVGRIIRSLRKIGVCEVSIAHLIVRRSELCLLDREDHRDPDTREPNATSVDDHKVLTGEEQSLAAGPEEVLNVAASEEMSSEKQSEASQQLLKETEDQGAAVLRITAYPAAAGSPSCSSLASPTESCCSVDLVWNPSPEPRFQLAPLQEQRSFAPEEKVALLQDIANVLPFDNTLPVNFLFALLRYAFALEASDECKSHIEARISLQLENATLEDILMFSSASKQGSYAELDSLMQIVSRFLGHQQQQRRIMGMRTSQVDNELITQQYQQVRALSKVWDEYLEEIAKDANISAGKFVQLVEVIPGYARVNHDQLYKVIQMFLTSHPGVSSEDHSSVCQSLNCLKLSQEVCVQAVQNELMPLRMVVQAMFVQQLQTRNAIATHLRVVNASQGNSPTHTIVTRKLAKQGIQMKINDIYDDAGGVKESTASLIEELQETNMRLQTLEAAMVHMRKSLSTTTRLSDFNFGCHDNSPNNSNLDKTSESVSCSSSRSSPSPSNNNNNNTSSSHGRKWRFFRKSSSSRSNNSTGLPRIVKMFERLGVFGLCKAAHKNFPENSFKDLPSTKASNCPKMTPGCLPADQFASRGNPPRGFRGKAASSWDDGYDGAIRSSQQHARHHSIA